MVQTRSIISMGTQWRLKKVAIKLPPPNIRHETKRYTDTGCSELNLKSYIKM